MGNTPVCHCKDCDPSSCGSGGRRETFSVENRGAGNYTAGRDTGAEARYAEIIKRAAMSGHPEYGKSIEDRIGRRDKVPEVVHRMRSGDYLFRGSPGVAGVVTALQSAPTQFVNARDVEQLTKAIRTS